MKGTLEEVGEGRWRLRVFVGRGRAPGGTHERRPVALASSLSSATAWGRHAYAVAMSG